MDRRQTGSCSRVNGLSLAEAFSARGTCLRLWLALCIRRGPATTGLTIARSSVTLLLTRAGHAADDPAQLVCAPCCECGARCLRSASRRRRAWLRAEWLRFQPGPGRLALRVRLRKPAL